MKAQLPERILSVLMRAGNLAERTGVAAYVVGGLVRDLLLGRQNLDADIVVEGDGLAFAKALGRETKATVKTHSRFGTAIVTLPDHFKVDVATARTEYYECPAALPTVEPSSINKDLSRRDFTINALAVRLNTKQFGELIDEYGGRRDLHKGTIRVLHRLSFVEDPTRMFRAVRFAHRFGFRFDRETLALIKSAVRMELVHRLSGARLCREFIGLLSEEAPRKTLSRLNDLQLLRFIHPQLQWSSPVGRLLKATEDALDWYRVLFLGRHVDEWVVYVTALLDGLPAGAFQETVRRLRVPARQADKMNVAREQGFRLLPRLNERPLSGPAEVYRQFEGLSHESLLFVMAKARHNTIKRQIAAYLTTYEHVRPALTGHDLQRMGLKPGPMFQNILDHLLNARLHGDVHTKVEERRMVKALMQRGKGFSLCP